MTSTPDGGGKVGAARRTIVGRERVARYLADALGRLAPTGLEMFLAEVNAGPAVVAFDGGELRGVLALEFVDGRVRALHIAANPDKLIFLGRQFAALSHPGTPLGSTPRTGSWRPPSEPADRICVSAAVAELVALTIAAALPAGLLILTRTSSIRVGDGRTGRASEPR